MNDLWLLVLVREGRATLLGSELKWMEIYSIYQLTDCVMDSGFVIAEWKDHCP